MSELRQRQVPKPNDTRPSPHDTEAEDEVDLIDEEPRGISLVDILRVLVTMAVASCGLSYYMTSSESLLWGYRPWFTKWPEVIRYIVRRRSLRHKPASQLTLRHKQQGPLTLTPAQLSLYNGTDPALPIYLAVNGSVFDVSANPMIYGPGGSYNFFAGKDATRAFVTGCFREDLTPDLAGVEEMFVPVDDEELGRLTSAQRKVRREQDVRTARARVRKTVDHWEGFFRNHKRYFQVGRVVGGEVRAETPRELCEAARMARPKREA